MQPKTIQQIRAALSSERFEAYRPLKGSDEDAVACYLWNLALCESLFCLLHSLEIVYRNALHQSIGIALKSPDWLLNGPRFLSAQEEAAVVQAKVDLMARGAPVTEGRIIAELSFGFWTSLADSRYDRLWPKIIRSAFPGMLNAIRTRPEISARISKVRRLRNAVFHHHSIWKWSDLGQQHADGYELIRWISPEVAVLIMTLDRFKAIHSIGYVGLKNNLKT